MHLRNLAFCSAVLAACTTYSPSPTTEGTAPAIADAGQPDGGTVTAPEGDHDAGTDGSKPAESDASLTDAAGDTRDAAVTGSAGGDAGSGDAGNVDAGFDAGPPDAGDGSPEQACVDKINAYRATVQAPPLARAAKAEEDCSDGQAQADVLAGKTHTTFPACGETGQSECRDYPGTPASTVAPCLADLWSVGPGTDFAIHGDYINMVSTAFTRAACGFETTNDGKVWIVVNYFP